MTVAHTPIETPSARPLVVPASSPELRKGDSPGELRPCQDAPAKLCAATSRRRFAKSGRGHANVAAIRKNGSLFVKLSKNGRSRLAAGRACSLRPLANPPATPAIAPTASATASPAPVAAAAPAPVLHLGHVIDRSAGLVERRRIQRRGRC